jgi:hypothetical protein
MKKLRDNKPIIGKSTNPIGQKALTITPSLILEANYCYHAADKPLEVNPLKAKRYASEFVFYHLL